MRSNLSPSPFLRATDIATACSLVLAIAGSAVAMPIEVGDGADVKVNWDNTLKYSNAFRLRDRSPVLTARPDADDGDRNFDKGLISNRMDLLSEFDIVYKKTQGLRLSGAAWYDAVYNRGNSNDSPGTVNYTSVPPNQFPEVTRKLHGRKAELLDAFVFGNYELGDSQLAVRLGKHTLQYGETLFFGANGIAAAQSPIDVNKALSVPNIKFNELIRPVPQVSGLLQITPSIAVGAYYQFKWEANRLPAVGSYFAFTDSLPDGGESLVLPGVFNRGPDTKARNAGQFGGQLRFNHDQTDYGIYAAKWHAKDGMLLADIPTNTYSYFYPEDIKTVGASVSRTVGPVNFAAEASMRWNMPLSSTQAPPFTAGSDNDKNPIYAVGRTAHFNVSAFGSFGRALWWTESALLAEIGFNRLLSVTKNPTAMDPGMSRDASTVRVIFEPTNRQFLSGVDISTPVTIAYDLDGRSAITGWAKGNGMISLGLNAVYQDQWRAGLNYTHFIGAAGTLLGTTPGYPGPTLNGKQFWADRDYISFSLRRTF